MPFDPLAPIDTLGSHAQQLGNYLLQFNEYIADGGDTLYGAASSLSYQPSTTGPSDGLITYTVTLPVDHTVGDENQLELRIPDDF